MKPHNKKRDVMGSGNLSEAHFGISMKDQAHILNILRDKLYTNKIQALVREYAANAWDAHREVGKGDVPIEVRLPTAYEPALVIRDYGPGLSLDGIQQVYIQFGASTKRNSNDPVGTFGVGAKCAHAYNDMFTITSWHGGTKRIFHAFLDESDMGKCVLKHEEPCGDETGIEIKVPCRPDDVYRFQQEAKWILPFIHPTPVTNIVLPELPVEMVAGDVANRNDPWGEISPPSRWVAQMGCVPYPLNLDQLKKEFEEEGLSGFITKLSGLVHFEIGDVDPAVSREGLDFTDRTKAAVVKKFKALRDEVLKDVVKELQEAKSLFAKRLLSRSCVLSFAMKPPGRYTDYAKAKVNLWAITKEELDNGVVRPKTFTMRGIQNTWVGRPIGYDIRAGNPLQAISISSTTKLWVQDNKKKLRGYFDVSLPDDQYLITPKTGFKVKDVEEELKELIKAAKLTGIPVDRISSRSYTMLSSGAGSRNSKHRATYFTLKEDAQYYRKRNSDNWDIAEREPTDRDITFVLHRFEAKPHLDVDAIKTNEGLLREVFGLGDEDFPMIFGIKTTDNEPVYPNSKPGMDYKDWFGATLKTCLETTPNLRLMASTYEWANFSFGLTVRRDSKTFAHAKSELGEDNPMVAFAMKVFAAQKVMQTTLSGKKHSLRRVKDHMERAGLYKSETKSEIRRLKELYPTLTNDYDGPGLWAPLADQMSNYYNSSLKKGEAAKAWVEHVKWADEARYAALGKAEDEDNDNEAEEATDINDKEQAA